MYLSSILLLGVLVVGFDEKNAMKPYFCGVYSSVWSYSWVIELVLLRTCNIVSKVLEQRTMRFPIALPLHQQWTVSPFSIANALNVQYYSISF